MPSTEEVFNVLTYDYEKAINILAVPDTYQTIVELVTPSREQGTYEYKMAMTYTFDQANKSVYMQWSADGGVTWREYVREPKDKTDLITADYFFPREHNGGAMSLIIQARKEDSAGILNFTFANAIIHRVG